MMIISVMFSKNFKKKLQKVKKNKLRKRKKREMMIISKKLDFEEVLCFLNNI